MSRLLIPAALALLALCLAGGPGPADTLPILEVRPNRSGQVPNLLGHLVVERPSAQLDRRNLVLVMVMKQTLVRIGGRPATFADLHKGMWVMLPRDLPETLSLPPQVAPPVLEAGEAVTAGDPAFREAVRRALDREKVRPR